MEYLVTEKSTLYTYIETKIERGSEIQQSQILTFRMQIMRDLLTSLNTFVNVFIYGRTWSGNFKNHLEKLLHEDHIKGYFVSSTFKKMPFPSHRHFSGGPFSFIISSLFFISKQVSRAIFSWDTGTGPSATLPNLSHAYNHGIILFLNKGKNKI